MFRMRFGTLAVAVSLGLVSGCSFCFSTQELFHRRPAPETTCCTGSEGAGCQGPVLDGLAEGPALPPNPGCIPVPLGSTPQLAPAPRLVPEAAPPQPYNPPAR
jgi:hypothetical protein